MKLSLIIEAINRASRPIDGVTRSVGGLRRSTREASGGLSGMSREMVRAERGASRLVRAGYRIGFGIGAGVRRSLGALSALDRKLQFTRAQMHGMALGGAKALGIGLHNLAVGGASIAAAGALAALYKVVTSGLQFEKYRTQLTGLEGSEKAGRRAMAWVTDFARKTPYELADVMDAFIALKSYGIDPTDGSLRMLGNAASDTGSSLRQTIEMFAGARDGEFDALERFGVRATVASKKVTFAYTRDGRNLTKTVRQSTNEIQKAISSILDDRFAGGMERLAKTTEGKWSQMMNRMTTTANRVWEGGLSASVNKQLDRFSGWIDQLEADGSLKKWADETGKGIGDFVDNMANADWKGIGNDITTVAKAIGALAASIRELQEWGAWLNKKGSDFAGSLGSVALDGSSYRAPDWARRLAGDIPAPRQRTDPNSNGVPLLDNRTGRPVAPRRPAPQMRPPRPSPTVRPPARPPAPGKAHVSLDISADRGLTVTPTKVAASGMDVEVNTGAAMRRRA